MSSAVQHFSQGNLTEAIVYIDTTAPFPLRFSISIFHLPCSAPSFFASSDSSLGLRSAGSFEASRLAAEGKTLGGQVLVPRVGEYVFVCIQTHVPPQLRVRCCT